jgi:endonuclease V-like protein UPF0215 family
MKSLGNQWVSWEYVKVIYYYCDVAVTQINYHNLNKQDNIKQARRRSHEKHIVQIFMLYDIQLGGFEVIYVML